MNVLLSGVVGSTAYGLAGPGSDVDRLGMFAWPTVECFNLTLGKETIDHHQPDVTFHEAAKAARLLLGCNPTVTELLWLESYETTHPLGAELIDLRSAFLSSKRVRDAYRGYAAQQFRRLLNKDTNDRDPARIAKHARHLLRLSDQGHELYTTGHLTVRLTDPQRYLDFGERVSRDPQAAADALTRTEERFETSTTALPDVPDTRTVQEWVNRVRHTFYAPDDPGYDYGTAVNAPLSDATIAALNARLTARDYPRYRMRQRDTDGPRGGV